MKLLSANDLRKAELAITIFISPTDFFFPVIIAIRRFRNKFDIVDEPNSSSKYGIRMKFFSLIKRNLVFWWEYEPIRKLF